jgi:hypothetical protein
MTERPAGADTDDIERHPDYLPEPDFYDEGEDEGAEDAAPKPAEDDDAG